MATPISNATLVALRSVLEADPDVDVGALFGSAVRDRLGPQSDVDVYVRLPPGARWSLRRAGELAHAMERVVRREVDLVVEDRDATSTVLRMEVARHGKLIFERGPGLWTSVRADAFVDHADMEPYLARCGAGIRRRLREGAGG